MPKRRLVLATMTAAMLASACAHAPRPDVARATRDLRCEEAARAVAARARTLPLDDLRRSVTVPLSLVASGAGWVTDGALVVSAGTVGTGVICAPLFLLEASAQGSGSATAECVVQVGAAVFSALPSPGFGKGLYRATRSWRCPDFVQLSREVNAVAGCYEARDGPWERDLAFQHLEQLHSDREIWACLPGDERRALEATRARLLSPGPTSPAPLAPGAAARPPAAPEAAPEPPPSPPPAAPEVAPEPPPSPPPT